MLCGKNGIVPDLPIELYVWAAISFYGFYKVIYALIPRIRYYKRMRKIPANERDEPEYCMSEERVIRGFIKLLGTSSAVATTAVTIWFPSGDLKRLLVVVLLCIINACFALLIKVDDTYGEKIYKLAKKNQPKSDENA